MSTTTGTDPAGHPIVSFAVRARQVLAGLAQVPAWSMSVGEQRAALVALGQVAAGVAELRLRVLAAGDVTDVAADTAATSTGAWLAAATTVPVGDAHRDVRLARALADGFAATREALAAGRVDVEQARVVVASVQGLPVAAVAADRSVVERAEKHLLSLAEGTDTPDGDTAPDDNAPADDAAPYDTAPGNADAADPGSTRRSGLDAVRLRKVGRHLFDVLDPAAADELLGRRLEAEERAAARKTYLSMVDNGDGTHSGRFKISDLHAAMLNKALEALTAPRHQHQHSADGEPGEDRAERVRLSRPEIMGQGFCRLLERLPAHRLPRAGGMSATVVVLLDYDKLLSGLGTATLDTGQVISAAMARRMACQSNLIPVVYRQGLGGRSVVLDVGRRRRLHDQYQRIGLVVQDRGCATLGCDRPPVRTEAHHKIAWSRGGATSLVNGTSLCAYHHHIAHSPDYDMRTLPDGTIRFHRRT